MLNSFLMAVSPLTPTNFCVPAIYFGGGQIFAQKWGRRNFLKNYLLDSFDTWHLPIWGESVTESLDPYSLSYLYCQLQPAGLICLKMKFDEFIKKNISSIHLIPSIYPSGISLLAPIHVRVSTVNFGPLVASGSQPSLSPCTVINPILLTYSGTQNFPP